MREEEAARFFKRKRPWSRYKDGILKYYLDPYLSKVRTLHKPIAIVDCFAGAGKFEDGTLGSPLLIANALQRIQARGATVRALFCEKFKNIFEQLEANLATYDIPMSLRNSSFRDCVDEIEQLARTHAIFVYLDPIRPGHLDYSDLGVVYDKLKVGQSVETLINFMSRDFTRRTQGLLPRASEGGTLRSDHRDVLACDRIAGGTYWQDIVTNTSLTQAEKVERIAEGYSRKLSEKFRWVLKYAVKQSYDHQLPRYHLVFGSRSPHAVDLMNRSMVKARMEFVGARFVDEMLFDNRPDEEIVKPHEVPEAVIKTSQAVGRTTWRLLRAHATIRYPCLYRDTDFNQAIKKMIANGKLGSSCAGHRIEQEAEVWPLAT